MIILGYLTTALAVIPQVSWGMKVLFSHETSKSLANQHHESFWANSGHISLTAKCENSAPKATLGWAVFHVDQFNDFCQPQESKGSLVQAKTCCCAGNANITLQKGMVCSNGLIVRESAKEQIYGTVVECQEKGIEANVEPMGIDRDGYWYAVAFPCAPGDTNYTGQFVFEHTTGYLPAEQHPLLVAHRIMTLLFAIMVVAWFGLMACYWQDILKLQYWTSAVLLLSTIQTAMFYGWYAHGNSKGTASKPLLGFAVLFMVINITIARMLVLIVAKGYGVVRPSLNEDMWKIVSFGIVYFTCAMIYWQVFYIQQAHSLGLSQTDENALFKVELFSVFPLSLLDACVVVWILHSLYYTMSQLKTRNKVVKYTMYRKFLTVLISAVIIALVCLAVQFMMLWPGTKNQNWNYRWFESVAWKSLFVYLLLSIMILWRPNANNKRFAYVPLESEDDSETHPALPTAFGESVKMRNLSGNGPRSSGEDENDLKWADENIATTYETDEMLFDDEEERQMLRLELNKMQ